MFSMHLSYLRNDPYGVCVNLHKGFERTKSNFYNAMKRIKKLYGKRRHTKKWLNIILCSASVACIFLLWSFTDDTFGGESKSYNYFSGWQPGDVCNNSRRHGQFYTTIHGEDFDLHYFIHNPKKDYVSKQLYDASNFNDLSRLKIVKSFLDLYTDINYVVDIGAHVGTLSVLSALMGKRVISIDAEIKNLQILCSTLSYLRLHENVLIINEVAGISHTAVTWVHQTNGNYTDGTVDINDDMWIKGGGSHNLLTEGRSPIMIDNLVNLIPSIKKSNVFISIDVNGYEHMVLLGAQLFMKKANVKGVFINFKHHKTKSSGMNIVKLLAKFGLHPYRFVENTLIYLEEVVIEDWPDEVMWI